uniref:Cyclin N-terminal domain-containing protein n=1 Tax=Palpitomonas bilix TaxID=652834 RepID=A0A7S3DE84_9EUKA|mmetsp:Transcript_3411/g.6717  ORF Transcript_3411/g.6717 Transcript_3411/m.6717 type:complete len:308 (+) Transcript_3411:103-1026(+)
MEAASMSDSEGEDNIIAKLPKKQPKAESASESSLTINPEVEEPLAEPSHCGTYCDKDLVGRGFWLCTREELPGLDVVEGNMKEEVFRENVDKGFNVIEDLCDAVNGSITAKHSAMLLYRRLYVIRHMEAPEYLDFAVAAIFASLKIEETPRKADYVFKKMRDMGDRLYKEVSVQDLDFSEWKGKLLERERQLLAATEFDTVIEHPLPHLKELWEKLDELEFQEELKRKIQQWSTNFLNDSYRTDALLLAPPRVVAGSALLLALLCNNAMPTGDEVDPYAVLDLPKAMVEEICHALIDFYEQPDSDRD